MMKNEVKKLDELVVGASAAIIDYRGKIFLTERNSSLLDFGGCWTFPGGKVEGTDKTVKETMIREVEEETGFKPKSAVKFGFYKSHSGPRRIISLVFLVREWTGKLKIQEEEVSNVGWFYYDEAIKLKLAFAYRNVIEDLFQVRLLALAPKK